jgi:hypothetical protein
MAETGWSKLFEDPVTLRNGRKLVTLLDAGNYIASLPRKEAEGHHWQAAVEAWLRYETCFRELFHGLEILSMVRGQPLTAGGTNEAINLTRAKDGPRHCSWPCRDLLRSGRTCHNLDPLIPTLTGEFEEHQTSEQCSIQRPNSRTTR